MTMRRPRPLMGYRAAGVRNKKYPTVAWNFHKTIPRVLINLSCSFIQARRRRYYSLVVQHTGSGQNGNVNSRTYIGSRRASFSSLVKI